tara:strand:- start:656 stop:1564 length:909 start_codon:yes stop_codon:yes gene_type:complete
MRVLVTGGVGFVGTNLVKRLLADGHEVESVDNYSTGKEENEQKGCVYHHKDLSVNNWWSLRDNCYCQFHCDCQIEPVDIIFHLAAVARIQPSFKHPKYTFDSNVTSTLNVLEWAKWSETPVVYAGSSSSNGDKYANPYTLSKSHGEELIELYNKVYDLPTAICRFYNVYGEHQLTEGDYCTLIGIFETIYKEGKPFVVTGDGEQRRDFTYVGDIADGLIRCGKSLFMAEISGETFELGRGKNYSVNEIVDAFGKNYQTQYIDARPGEMRETLNTDDKARDVLGWKPKVDIIKYIKENYILDK